MPLSSDMLSVLSVPLLVSNRRVVDADDETEQGQLYAYAALFLLLLAALVAIVIVAVCVVASVVAVCVDVVVAAPAVNAWTCPKPTKSSTCSKEVTTTTLLIMENKLDLHALAIVSLFIALTERLRSSVVWFA